VDAITCKNVCKVFKVKKHKVKALNSMNLNIEKGEIYGFLGPNGAGKSTTLKILMDLIRADSGSVKIMGRNSSDYKARKRVGFLPENPSFMDNLTGREIVKFSGKVHGMPPNQLDKKIIEILDLLDLSEAAERPVRKYSKGMVQRVGFAAAIVHDPDLLILDEPMSGLDPMGRVLFKSILKDINKKGTTVLFSSHIIPDIEDICTKIGIVKNGRLLREITSTEMKYTSTHKFKIIFKHDGNVCENILDYKVSGIDENLGFVTVGKEKAVDVIDYLRRISFDLVDIQPEKKDLETLFVEISGQSNDNE